MNVLINGVLGGLGGFGVLYLVMNFGLLGLMLCPLPVFLVIVLGNLIYGLLNELMKKLDKLYE